MVVTCGGGREGVETVGGVDDTVEIALATDTDEDSTVVVFSTAIVVGVDFAVSSSFLARRCLMCCTYLGIFTLRYSDKFVPGLGG